MYFKIKNIFLFNQNLENNRTISSFPGTAGSQTEEEESPDSVFLLPVPDEQQKISQEVAAGDTTGVKGFGWVTSERKSPPPQKGNFV